MGLSDFIKKIFGGREEAQVHTEHITLEELPAWLQTKHKAIEQEGKETAQELTGALTKLGEDLAKNYRC